MKTTYALARCPFCGGEPQTNVSYTRMGGSELTLVAQVECMSCGTRRGIRFDANDKPFDTYFEHFERAVELWNQRA